MVDQYSGFPFTQRLRSTSTDKITATLTSWFLDWGFPKTIRSDNGPQFREKFKQFCEANGIKHETSSPYHPASNGLAEAAVKNVKRLLGKCLDNDEDFRTALMEWRNCPRADGYSPAQAFLGRRLRGLLPNINKSPIDLHNFEKKRHLAKEATKVQFNKNAKDLPTLRKGDKVLIQDPITKAWNSYGKIMDIYESGRSYDIETENMKRIRRNRKFLRLSKQEVTEENSSAEDSSEKLTPISSLRKSERVKKKRVSFS